MRTVPTALTTEGRYRKYVAQKGLPEDVETLPSGDKILWIGARSASAAVVYFHGGGLCQPAIPGQMTLIGDGYATFQRNGQDASIAIVVYGLAPHVTYPTPLRQAVGAVNHLLGTRSPERIHFVADSAGGQLLLALMLHHQHAHPLVDALSLAPGLRFGQALLLSPAGAIPTSTVSMRQIPLKDTLTPDMLRRFLTTIQSNCEPAIALPNPWMALYETPADWWADLPLDRLVITLGDDEILRDDILTFASRILTHHRASVEILKAAGEGHDQPVMDIMLGAKQASASGRVAKAWFEAFRA